MRKKVLNSRKGEGYVDTSVKILIAVVCGALLLGSVFWILKDTVLKNVKDSIVTMFDTPDKNPIDNEGDGGDGGVEPPDITPVTEKHPDQIKNDDIGTGINRPVNLDNWGYSVVEDDWTNPPPETIGKYNAFYIGSFVDGKIIGDVPTYINGIPVIKVGFSGNPEFTEGPIIPATVTNASYMFNSSYLVTPPTFWGEVTNMQGAFNNSANLKTAPTLPTSVTNMANAFSGCSSLETPPTIPNGVKDMSEAFRNCTSLKSAPAIPGSVETAYNAFRDCTSLQTAGPIANGAKNVSYMFSGCTSLTAAPNIGAVQSLEATFSGCTSLKTAGTIAEGVTNMASTFGWCSNLETIVAIPSTVTNLGGTFTGCAKVTGTFFIPDGILTIHGGTFSGCGDVTLQYHASNTVMANLASSGNPPNYHFQVV